MSQAEPACLDDLSAAILQELWSAPRHAEISLPRLGKALGVGVSVLMRRLALMGPASLGGAAGPGWVRVTQLENRWTAALTDEGRALFAEPEPASHAPSPL